MGIDTTNKWPKETLREGDMPITIRENIKQKLTPCIGI
jgi:hypothetical protein